MTAKADIVNGITVLSTHLHWLSDKSLIDLFEFASKTPWQNRLCHSTKADVNYTDVFCSIVAITPISRDTLVLFLAWTKARFQSHLESKMRTKKEISIGTFIDLSLYFKVSQFSAASTINCQVERSLEDCLEKQLFFTVDLEHVSTYALSFEPHLFPISNGKESTEPEKLILCKEEVDKTPHKKYM